jgi:hypothetical protein
MPLPKLVDGVIETMLVILFMTVLILLSLAWMLIPAASPPESRKMNKRVVLEQRLSGVRRRKGNGYLEYVQRKRRNARSV